MCAAMAVGSSTVFLCVGSIGSGSSGPVGMGNASQRCWQEPCTLWQPRTHDGQSSLQAMGFTTQVVGCALHALKVARHALMQTECLSSSVYDAHGPKHDCRCMLQARPQAGTVLHGQPAPDSSVTVKAVPQAMQANSNAIVNLNNIGVEDVMTGDDEACFSSEGPTANLNRAAHSLTHSPPPSVRHCSGIVSTQALGTHSIRHMSNHTPVVFIGLPRTNCKLANKYFVRPLGGFRLPLTTRKPKGSRWKPATLSAVSRAHETVSSPLEHGPLGREGQVAN